MLLATARIFCKTQILNSIIHKLLIIAVSALLQVGNPLFIPLQEFYALRKLRVGLR